MHICPLPNMAKKWDLKVPALHRLTKNINIKQNLKLKGHCILKQEKTPQIKTNEFSMLAQKCRLLKSWITLMATFLDQPLVATAQWMTTLSNQHWMPWAPCSQSPGCAAASPARHSHSHTSLASNCAANCPAALPAKRRAEETGVIRVRLSAAFVGTLTAHSLLCAQLGTLSDATSNHHIRQPHEGVSAENWGGNWVSERSVPGHLSKGSCLRTWFIRDLKPLQLHAPPGWNFFVCEIVRLLERRHAWWHTRPGPSTSPRKGVSRRLSYSQKDHKNSTASWTVASELLVWRMSFSFISEDNYLKWQNITCTSKF